MENCSEVYDALIVGGGPAGASTAVHLAARGARVLLAERERFPRAKLCGEFISPECLEQFARLGVADAMGHAGGVEVEETVFYTRAGSRAAVPSAWFGAGSARALGLSRAEMDERLLDRARAVGVEVVEEAQAVGILMEGVRVCGVRLSRRGAVSEHRSRVTIDATGRARTLARFAGREARRASRLLPKRAPLVAFKAHLEGARGAASVCEIYFYRGGYGGLSPIEGGRSNLCFIARASDVRACASDAERVMREIVMTNARAAHTLGAASAATPWLSVALEGFGRRETPSPAPGLLTIGDAAAFIDPFTGSGMLMALESGELAAEVLTRWLERSSSTRGDDKALDELARDYAARYESRFAARLRLSSWLRRAAFAPHAFAETAVFVLGASASVRRRLARATREAEARL